MVRFSESNRKSFADWKTLGNDTVDYPMAFLSAKFAYIRKIAQLRVPIVWAGRHILITQTDFSVKKCYWVINRVVPKI